MVFSRSGGGRAGLLGRGWNAPPEANLAFKKSNEGNNGVIAMIDLLVADLDLCTCLSSAVPASWISFIIFVKCIFYFYARGFRRV